MAATGEKITPNGNKTAPTVNKTVPTVNKTVPTVNKTVPTGKILNSMNQLAEDHHEKLPFAAKNLLNRKKTILTGRIRPPFKRKTDFSYEIRPPIKRKTA